MRPCKRSAKSRVAGAMAVLVLALGASAYGQVIEWVPVSSTGPANIIGNEIIISSGGVEVQFDIHISGWANGPASPQLGAFQGTAVGTDMLGINAIPPNPGVDLSHPTPVACTSDADCGGGLCGSLLHGFCADQQPGFQILFTCLDDSSIACSVGSQCPGRQFCLANPNYILDPACGPNNAVALPSNGNYEFIGACANRAVTDPGTPRYAGSIRFVVPVDARGTYAITFNPSGERTFLNNEDGVTIQGLVKIDGLLTIETGCCCFGIGSAQPNCIDNVVRSECDARPGPRIFEPGDGPCCLSDDVTFANIVCADDCDGDGILNIDETNLAEQDCNDNGVCNGNEILFCTRFDLSCKDCNVNGLPDICDIDDGTSADCDSDGILDECVDKGDMNEDGIVDIEDVLQFIDCLQGPELALGEGCVAADFDSDCDVDLTDAAEFFTAF